MENVDWQERANRLALPRNFNASVSPSELLQVHLTLDEWTRLNMKMRVVENAAKHMATGMCKGTLKYESDDLTVKEWLEHLSSEIYDTVNYLGFMTLAK